MTREPSTVDETGDPDLAPPPRTPRPGVRRCLAMLLALVLVGGVVFAIKRPGAVPPVAAPVVDRIPGVELDSDGDGLLDELELGGWLTASGRGHQTDPYKSDTDGDGLDDSYEAGPRADFPDGSSTYAGRSDPTRVDTDADGLSDAVETGEIDAQLSASWTPYAVSNPLVADTDGDEIGDGDEYFLDMDPLDADSDGDGLFDVQELRFGSDPTLGNPDEDSYSDLEEFERNSSPLSYDLTADEKRAAGGAGATYGDCHSCALDAGLAIEQIESVEYLAGHIASSVAVYGDARDFVVNVWKGEFLDAGESALAAIPYAGDAARTASLLTTFAKRGDRAEDAVRLATEKLRLPESLKARIFATLPSRVGKLPRELAGGAHNYVVYKGDDYVGITKNFDVRLAQHSRAGRTFTPAVIPGAEGLSFGEARAMEQACIQLGGLMTGGGSLQNRINSIDSSHAYAAAAVEYGFVRLKQIGGTCPIGMIP